MAFTPQGVQPGQPPLSPGQQSGLAAALAKTEPPQNPKTMAQRTNPQYLRLQRLHSIRAAIDKYVQEGLDDQPDDEQILITAMRHAADRLLKGVDGKEVVLTLAQEATQTVAPEVAQAAQQALANLNRPPMAPGMPQLTGMPGGAPPGPPGGMPPGGPPGPPAGGPMPPMGGAPPVQPPLPSAAG